MASEWEPLEEGDESAYLAQEKSQEASHSVRTSSLGQASSAAGSHGKSSHASVAHPTRLPITHDLILKALERQGVRLTHQDRAADEKLVAKQTHLHLNGKGITHIDALKGMPKLEVLYLYDNRIETIEGLAALPSLTHLYLQDNLISQVTGLAALAGLQKLYLQGNHIRRLSGLGGLINLEELHVSNQHLPPGEPLEFDPAALEEVAPTLRVLTAVACNLTDGAIGPLSQLSELRRLELGGNCLAGFEGVEGVLRGLPRLVHLDLRGNPLCRAPKYREQVIVMSDSVSMLDDEAVPQAQREVLMRLHIRKMKAALAADLAAAAAAQEGAQGIAAGAGGSRQGGRLESGSGSGSGSGQQQGGAVSVSPGVRPLVTHPVTRHVAPPVAAGFGAPRHLARQVSGSGRARAQPTIPGRGDAEDVQLGMQGVQLRDR